MIMNLHVASNGTCQTLVNVGGTFRTGLQDISEVGPLQTSNETWMDSKYYPKRITTTHRGLWCSACPQDNVATNIAFDMWRNLDCLNCTDVRGDPAASNAPPFSRTTVVARSYKILMQFYQCKWRHTPDDRKSSTADFFNSSVPKETILCLHHSVIFIYFHRPTARKRNYSFLFCVGSLLSTSHIQ